METAALIAIGAHRMVMPFLVVARLEWNRPGIDNATTGDAIAVAALAEKRSLRGVEQARWRLNRSNATAEKRFSF
jgi:hypothetical protein